MELTWGWSLLLIVTAAWNLVIWPPFLRRVLADERSRDADGRATTFLRVHTVLIGVSLLLALLVGLLGVLSLI